MWKNSITISSFSKTSFCNPPTRFSAPASCGCFFFSPAPFLFLSTPFLQPVFSATRPFPFTRLFSFSLFSPASHPCFCCGRFFSALALFPLSAVSAFCALRLFSRFSSPTHSPYFFFRRSTLRPLLPPRIFFFPSSPRRLLSCRLSPYSVPPLFFRTYVPSAPFFSACFRSAFLLIHISTPLFPLHFSAPPP